MVIRPSLWRTFKSRLSLGRRTKMDKEKEKVEEFLRNSPPPKAEMTASGGEVDKAIYQLTDEIAEAGGFVAAQVEGMLRAEEPLKESPINELPKAGLPLPAAEQLAHTQTAYKCLLEDFTKVSQQLAELKEANRILLRRSQGTV
jgi:hypothetical protein